MVQDPRTVLGGDRATRTVPRCGRREEGGMIKRRSADGIERRLGTRKTEEAGPGVKWGPCSDGIEVEQVERSPSGQQDGKLAGRSRWMVFAIGATGKGSWEIRDGTGTAD